MAKNCFLLLSLISGIVEIGLIIMGIKLQFGIVNIILIGLSYQIGNLVPNPIQINKSKCILISLLGSGALVGYLYTKEKLLLFISCSFLAMAIQGLRSIEKGKVATATKRTFRIIGFLFSFILTSKILLVISIAVLVISIFTKDAGKQCKIILPKMKFINLIMIVHQLHYFSYCYFIILVLYGILQKKNMFIIGVLFSLGWLTYSYIPNIIKGVKYEKYLIIGHVFLAVVLVCLSKATGLYVAILWILTGFGGGTVYCIDKVRERNDESDKNSMVFSENVGHILGIICGLIIYLISNSIHAPIFLAAIFALSTAILVGIHSLVNINKNRLVEE